MGIWMLKYLIMPIKPGLATVTLFEVTHAFFNFYCFGSKNGYDMVQNNIKCLKYSTCNLY